VDISNPHNRAVVDLEKAANLEDGGGLLSNVVVVQPIDPRLGNGSMLRSTQPRGAHPGSVDGGDQDPNKDPGDAWFLEHATPWPR
jgi:hypothetical protein